MRFLCSILFVLLAANLLAQPGSKDSSFRIVLFSDGVYTVATFPGGKAKLDSYIEMNRPKAVVCGHEPDHVRFDFELTIGSNGEVKKAYCDPEYYTNHLSCLQALEKMFLEMPQWEPAMNNDKAVESKVKVSVDCFL